MSFRELRNLAEMLRALGYPRPVSLENFRTPNFELVADLMYWMMKKYDPTSTITDDIDTEDDRIQFLMNLSTSAYISARIKLNPKKLYAADGFAVKEIIKLARVLYDASRIDAAGSAGSVDVQVGPNSKKTVTLDDDDDDDELTVKTLMSSRMKDPKSTRQLSSDITNSGAKLYDLLSVETEIRELRTQGLKFLDALSASANDHSIEQRYLERSIKTILETMAENVQLTERQCIELEAEEKALSAKMKKAAADLERSEKRLKSMQNVRPHFMDEYEKLEKELQVQYAIYCERFRNLDYLQRELDLHTSRELKKLAETDRSLKRLQKKFRDDELAILRGEQDQDPIDGGMALLNEEGKDKARKPQKRNKGSTLDNNQTGSNGKGKLKGNGEEVNKENVNTLKQGKIYESDSAIDENSSISGSDSGGGSEIEESNESNNEMSRNRIAATHTTSRQDEVTSRLTDSDSEEVSLADSGELIDNDDESGSANDEENSESGSSSEVSGSNTNSDSDQDF